MSQKPDPTTTGLPAGPLPSDVVDRLEAALAEFESAWSRGQRPTIDDYLAAVSAPERAYLLPELVQEELEFLCRFLDAPPSRARCDPMSSLPLWCVP
jgi:hypothetical protein